MSQVNVCDEFGFTKWKFPKAGDIFNIQAFKNRIYADPVSILKNVCEVHRFFVYQNKVNFCVGHSQGFDHVLY